MYKELTLVVCDPGMPYQLLIPPVTVCIIVTALVVGLVVLALMAVFYVLRCLAILGAMLFLIEMLAGLFRNAVRRR